MLYLLHFHFASSQRHLNLLSLLILDVYHLVSMSINILSLNNTSNMSLGFLVFSNEVILYINIYDEKWVCEILCKCYASLIVAHDGYEFF